MRSDLAQVVGECPIWNYSDYRSYIRDIYELMKAREKKYSYAALSSGLGFIAENHSYLVVTGKRRLTLAAADKLAKQLGFSNAEHAYLKSMVEYCNQDAPQAKTEAMQEMLRLRQRHGGSAQGALGSEFFESWLNAVVFEVLGLSEAPITARSIAQRLRLPAKVQEVEKSLQTLLSLGFVQVSAQGDGYVRTQEAIVSRPVVDNLGVVRFHQQMIEAGVDAMVAIPEEDREITCLTVGLPKESIHEMRRLCMEFKQSILALLRQSEPKDTVYQVNIQFFPMTVSQNEATTPDQRDGE